MTTRNQELSELIAAVQKEATAAAREAKKPYQATLKSLRKQLKSLKRRKNHGK